MNTSVSGSFPYERILCGYKFSFIQELNPERTDGGSILLFDPKRFYPKKDSTRLNRYGTGPFCRFSIHDSSWQGACGVYALFDDHQLLYIGLTNNLLTRFNQGYGKIEPVNCYVGGQSTNCKINAMVLKKYLHHENVYLFFHPTSAYKSIEAELIQKLSPPFNSAQPQRTAQSTPPVIQTTPAKCSKTPPEQESTEVPKHDFETIWQAIQVHAGETFHIPKGPFTYTAHESYIISSRASGTKLSRSNFEKAYRCIGTLSPTEFSKKIVGSSYVRAILTDPRILTKNRKNLL